jgi:RNA polymerase sigma-70 factor (ECF subfamily)
LIGLLASWGLGWRAAHEVAQDAFAEAWVGRTRLRADPADLDAVGAWLRGIAFHLSRAEQRREARTRSIDGGAVAELAATPATPFDAAEERRELLVAAFAGLRTSHQTVLRMHYLEETSAREVAALLGITPKAVESRLYQARRALRELVDRSAGHGSSSLRRDVSEMSDAPEPIRGRDAERRAKEEAS